MGIPISNVTRRVVYAASGTGPYNFTFEILAAGDVAVYKDDALLTITTDYTVTINANGTGFITLTAAPTGATQIAIVGNRTIQRNTDFVTGGDFFANTVNTELDSLTIFAQQNAESVERAMKAPQTDPTNINMTLPRAALRAGKTLAFDSNGNPTLGDTLGTNRGNWSAGTLYFVRDIVKDTSTSNVWQCLVQHTSSGTQPISTNTDAAKWFLLVDAASAGTSATNAANSATAAATSATNAASSASAAATSATNAANSASAASTSASNASSSASSASGSASTASTAATNASNSATAAATSATNAANSATAAAGSASSASSSASSASTSASNASTSATNAANSASSATSSASTATTQAGIATTQATNAATSATNAASSASAAASSASSAASSAAAAAAALDNFDDRYLGPKTSNPTVDNDGNALLTGALYYRTTAPIGMKVWDGSQWLEASAAQQASFITYEYTATAGQTTFSGNDANGVALSYIPGGVVVSINGVLQNPGDDYTASNGTSIVLTSAAALNDEIMVMAFRTFDVANTYTQAQTDALIAGRQPASNALTTYASTGIGFRNRIINGDMRIDQRNAGASVTINNALNTTYTVDRWRGNANGGGVFTVQRSSVAPAGFTNSLLATVTTADASVVSGDFYHVRQSIEGFNFSDLNFGSASAQAVTLSFWTRNSLTGTFTVMLRNEAGNRGYLATYTVSAANTWEYKTITIPGDTTGSWATDNTSAAIVSFVLGSGNSQSTNAWLTTVNEAASGMTQWIATNGATFYITGVQLEAGSVATPFERRDYGRELMMCQRYYEIAQGTETSVCPSPSTGGYAVTNSIRYAAVKRTAGTVTLNGVAGSNCASISVISSNIGGFVLQNQATGTGNSFATYNWNTSAEL